MCLSSSVVKRLLLPDGDWPVCRMEEEGWQVGRKEEGDWSVCVIEEGDWLVKTGAGGVERGREGNYGVTYVAPPAC